MTSLNLFLLYEYLIFTGDDSEPCPGERFSEMTSRLCSLFGSGWFFEWPGGKRPLNSTWPWADVKPSLLVLWGVCWMFVVAPVLETPRNSQGQGRHPNQRRDHRSPLHHSPHNYYYTQAEPPPPVVKRESVGHLSGLSISRPDWSYQANATSTSSPLDETYPLYSQTAQPMMGQTPNPLRYNQVGQADTAMATAPLSMRSAVPQNITTAMSPAHAHGCLDLDAYSNSTNTNTNDATRAAEYALAAGRLAPNSANLNVAKRSASVIPDFSGNDIFESNRNPSQNHAQQQGRYYESSRHNNKPQYPRSPATATLTPLLASTSPYYDYSSSVNAAMSLSYEPSRTLATYPSMMHEQPQEQDENNFQHHQYPSPPPLSENPYHAQGVVDPTAGINMEMPELPQKEDSDAPSPGRSRPIPKPDREVTKGQDGRFVCTWAACTEDVKSFNRKCEWSKHMDKHDRPYKCPADGCEKLPGFTYSGGLLRHQREVHNLHGGPRKQLNCPHPNCKRHSGKGFSRQENLNEHLRRVHTDAGQLENVADDTEDDGSERAGMKRKRGPGQSDGVAEMRAEVARLGAEAATLRAENDELRRNADSQQQSTAELMRQLNNLQTIVGQRMGQAQAPQAMM
ncbi:Zinc finger protein [Lachnellula occidentalis]|uniref:Zinc finger protein n=1 Tax=Lachnellula occidentalis TaxID=215460 RepID=A0A8H8UIL7_9HELO|nr:Zinc finger protein [Lachnellula occidentalis]